MTNGRLVAGLVRCLLLAAMLQVPAGAQGPGPSAERKLVAQFDKNGDKRLDAAELQTAFDAVAERTGKVAADAEAVIARLDRDGDGAVTRREIRAAVHDLRPTPASTLELARRADGTGA